MKKWINFLKISMAIIFMSLLILELSRPFTHWPTFHLYVTVRQEQLFTSVSIGDYMGRWNGFSYFTVLSNIIAVASIFLSWVFRIKIKSQIRLMILTYMVITALIFWTSLAPLLPWGQSAYFDFDSVNEHFIVLIGTVWWAFSERDQKEVKYKYYWMMIFPIIYLIFNLIFFIVTPTHVVVYPFLKFDNWFSYNWPLYISIICTLGSIVVIAFLFILIYWILLKVFKKINRKSKMLL